MPDENDVQEGLSKKELKKLEKERKKQEKLAKKNSGGLATTDNAMYTDAEADEGSSLSATLIVVFIVLIWVAILCLLIKLDIGGFGSDVLYPLLKDIPVINHILPSGVEEERLASESDYKTVGEAVAEINRLKAQIAEMEAAKSETPTSGEEIAALKEEILRLKTFEDSQVEFQKLKTEFYEEVVFSEKAPDIKEYKAYYEKIDPENAEYLYKQVVSQIETDKEIEDYVKAYSDMKPKAAAAIFEDMQDNLELVAEILGRMDPTARGKILQVMDSKVASKITKIMDPD